MSQLKQLINSRYSQVQNSPSNDFNEEESIYNLIPKEYVAPPKQSIYKSQFPHSIPPTGSTFCHKTTSIPKISNLAGSLVYEEGPHKFKAESALFGMLKDKYSLSPQQFLKKQSGIYSIIKNSKVGRSLQIDSKINNSRIHQIIKPILPAKEEVPIYGLKSSKNYIVANATEVILSVPYLPKIKQRYTEKKDYGKTPQYLQTIKNQIQNEYEKVRMLQLYDEQQKEKEKYLMNEEDINKLKEGLKKKYNDVFKKYQNLTHKTKFDTIGLKQRKENYEFELTNLEKDIEQLHRKYIFVDTQS